MDPISIITLCASATVSAYNVSQTLYSFINSSKNIDVEVEALAAEVTGVRRVLDAIGVIFANPLIRSEKATGVENAPIWAAVAGALNDCRVSIEDFNLQLTDHTRKPAGNSFLKQSLKWMKLSFKLADIGKLRFQMNTHANNLQISLQMVSILVSSIGPQQASVSLIGGEYSRLEKSISELTLVESNLPPDERQELHQRTEYLKKTANLVLRGLDGSAVAQNYKDQQDSQRLLSRVVADFNSSVYEKANSFTAFSDDSTEIEDDDVSDYETKGHDDELEHKLVRALFQKAEVHFSNKRWRLAETLLREGFQHLETTSTGGDDLDIVRVQLLLIQCCMHQNKWSEAELMLMIIVRPEPGTKISLATLQAYHFLSQAYLCQYDFNSALNYCREALEGRRRLLGKQHALTLSTLQLLALIHRSNGDGVSADAYMSLITGALQDNNENDIVKSRFQGYSTADQLRTTLAEKAAAIRELMKEGFIGGTPKSSPTDGNWSSTTAPLITFDPAAVDIDYGKALRWAVHTDHELVVRWLLSRGADPDTTDRGTPALVSAARGGHSDVVSTLLAAGAAINAPDNSGRTALLWASLWGYNASVRVLLQHGADANKADNDGASPLIDAAVKGHESTVTMLLDYGVNLEAKTSRGNTALLAAADNTEIEVCRVLVRRGADLHVRNLEEQTPLLIAAANREEVLIKLLVDAGSDVHAKDRHGATALRKLAPSGKPGSMRYLIEKGADVDATANDGSTALSECANAGYSGSSRLLLLLLESGADAGRAHDGRTPLEIAKWRQNQDCVEVIEGFLEQKRRESKAA